MLEANPNGKGSAQKGSITKWKLFIQEHASRGMQGGSLFSPTANFGNT